MRWNLFIPVALMLFVACQPLDMQAHDALPHGTHNDNHAIALDGLPEARGMEEVTLEDGDTFALTSAPAQVQIAGAPQFAYAYNGQVPGPALRVRQGSEITIDFTNNLPVETTVHWHGLRHDNKDDGVPGITQDPVMPGEAYRYTLKFPDEGIYWYHPHVREDAQQDLGLYGVMIVEPEEGTYNAVDREEILIFDDALVQGNRTVPHGSDAANFALMGRYGNVPLVNGKEDLVLQAKAGETLRLFVANVANARPLNLSVEGLPFKLIASDLSRYEREEMVESVVLGPAERAIVEVTFPEEGDYAISSRSPAGEFPLATFSVRDRARETALSAPHDNADVQEDIARFAQHFEKAPDSTLTLTVEMDAMMPGMDHDAHGGMPCHQMPDGSWMGECGVPGIEWEDDMGQMNEMATSDAITWVIEDSEGNQNMDVALRHAVGEVVKIRFVNTLESMHPMQHPIHLHGQRFLTTHIDGLPVQNKAWKDTVLIPAGSTVDILVDVTNPGEWMLHCHIAEHLTAGMMARFIAEDS